jgi:hypothetical protein
LTARKEIGWHIRVLALWRVGGSRAFRSAGIVFEATLKTEKQEFAP